MSEQAFVHWFRQCSPYVHAHRNKTFVIGFGGELLQEPNFSHFIHDIALLNSLGIRLVLIHGIRPQLEDALSKAGIDSHFEKGIRVTSPDQLPYLKSVVGQCRVDIEAAFSVGLANSPMAGAKVRVTSGNLLFAKPIGVRDGVDFCHTGLVRKVDREVIKHQLDEHQIVLLSPVGYSPTGEVFNMNYLEVAATVSSTLKADKLILLGESAELRDDKNSLVREISAQELRTLPIAAESRRLNTVLQACDAGVKRVHLLNHKIEGVLLQELFTRDGVGSLITHDGYESLRAATTEDVAGILALVEPLESQGALVRRSREQIEADITTFSVIERDGMIIGCAALHLFESEQLGELACLAVHPDYQKSERGARLLSHIERLADSKGAESLLLLSTQASHWFLEKGFEAADIEALPVARQALYNYQRRSKVFLKPLNKSVDNSVHEAREKP